MIEHNVMDSICTIRGYGSNKVWVTFESSHVSREEFERFVKMAESSPVLLDACEMALTWINNLVEAFGQDSVIDSMPNNCRGRMQIGEAITKAKGERDG